MKFKGNHELPSLNFDEDSGVLVISGRSISIEKDDFWNPLIAKMEEYLDDPRDITITFELEFFNTPSAKSILELCYLVAEKSEKSKRKFIVRWIYDDEDMLEAGEDYASMVKNSEWKLIKKEE